MKQDLSDHNQLSCERMDLDGAGKFFFQNSVKYTPRYQLVQVMILSQEMKVGCADYH